MGPENGGTVIARHDFEVFSAVLPNPAAHGAGMEVRPRRARDERCGPQGDHTDHKQWRMCLCSFKSEQGWPPWPGTSHGHSQLGQPLQRPVGCSLVRCPAGWGAWMIPTGSVPLWTCQHLPQKSIVNRDPSGPSCCIQCAIAVALTSVTQMADVSSLKSTNLTTWWVI